MDYYAEHHRQLLSEMGHGLNQDVKETVKSINLQMISVFRLINVMKQTALKTILNDQTLPVSRPTEVYRGAQSQRRKANSPTKMAA